MIGDIADMISQERRDVYYAMGCARTWKQSAKVNRARWLAVLRATRIRDIDETHDYVNELEATADRRLSYLRELELYLGKCPYCSLITSHADDCELAKELSDE
jgi:hypothetical protein